MTLRIQKETKQELVVFTLTGRIQAEQVLELEALLKSESSADRGITLDLSEVRLVDRDAVGFLARLEAEGTQLRNCSAYIREWISLEKRIQMRGNGKSPLRGSRE